MPSVFLGVGAGPSYRGDSDDEDEWRRQEIERRRMLEEEERRRVMEQYERRRALEERERRRVLEEEERRRVLEEQERRRAFLLEEEERQRRHTRQQNLSRLAATPTTDLSTIAIVSAGTAFAIQKKLRRQREREQEREEHARVQLQDWLRGWSGYDIKPGRQPPPPRYDPPEALSSNLARLADDLFPPTAPIHVLSLGTGRSHGRRKGKERRPQVFATPEPTRGVPPGLFDQPDRGFDKFATLAGQLSNLAKKAEGHGKLARELRKECVQTQQVNEVLFKDKQLLGGYTAVFDQLSPVGQMVLSAAAENSMGALLGALSGSSPDELGSTLGAALATVQQANDTVKGHIRHFLLESSAFNRLDVLANISQLQGGAAADLGLVADARLRAENIMNRPDLFESDGSGGFIPSGQPCYACCGDEDLEVASGKIDPAANDDFLMFPGRLNGMSVRALIDTGGGCNVVSAKWVKERGIEPVPDRVESLVMADASTAVDREVIEVKWSFDSRGMLWEKVEFVIVEESEFDALIGLPFLKHSQVLHNSAGTLVFPEYKGVHTEKKRIPLYHFKKLKASR